MRVSQISIENYCGARHVGVPIDEPVAMFCGPNGAGKSSIAEGVRQALYGSPARVVLKGDWPKLVTEGAKAGKVFVAYHCNDADGTAAVSVPGGERKTTGVALPDSRVMECLTYSRTFAAIMDADERRGFLFELLGITIDPAQVVALLRRRGCDAYYAEQAATMLHSGFNAAHEYAKDRTKEARGIWRSISGEAYGAKKAEEWKAEPGEPYDAVAHLADLERDGRIADAINTARAEVGALEIAADFSGACPHCGGVVALRDGVLVEHDGRDLSNEKEIAAKYDEIAKLREQQTESVATLHAHEVRKSAADTCARSTEAATAAHEEVKAWAQIAEHLAPDGVPLEMLAQQVAPFNDVLRGLAESADWPLPVLTPNMEVQAAGRPYSLLSESEKWRVDALAALAISTLSRGRFVMLDGFDVLDLEGRAELLNVLQFCVDDGQLETALLFGTLKATPPREPGFMQAFRVQAGAIVE